MWCSSKVSACRRGPNSHNAAQPRASGHSRQRAWLQAPVEPVRKEQAPVPRPFARMLRCIGPLYRLEAAPTLPQESVPRHGPQRAAAAPGAAHQGQRFFGWLPPVLHYARRCLTPRSSRAPTACHAGPAGGTRYIFATRARASHRWCRLNSNVRQRRRHRASLQQSQRLSAWAEQPQRGAAASIRSLAAACAWRPAARSGRRLVQFTNGFGSLARSPPVPTGRGAA